MAASSKAKPSDGAEGEPVAAGGGKKKLILIAAALVVLLGGGGGAAWFLGMFGGGAVEAAAEAPTGTNGHAAEAAGEGHAGGPADDEAASGASGHDAAAGQAEAAGAHADAAAAGVRFVTLPDVLVNLQSEGRRMRFLKLSVALEVADEPTAQAVQALAPRILDSFQLYLRTLSIDDLRGAAPVHRMKEQLLGRINQAVAPKRIEDVLIKEMLVQ